MEKLAPSEAEASINYKVDKSRWGEKRDIAMAAVFLVSEAGTLLVVSLIKFITRIIVDGHSKLHHGNPQVAKQILFFLPKTY